MTESSAVKGDTRSNLNRSMWGFVCDDVRREIGQKVSYMGIYNSTIVCAAFPTTLPQLCFVLSVRTPTNEPFQKLVFSVKKDDEVIVLAEVQRENLTGLSLNAPDVIEEGRVVVTVMATVANIEFTGPCKLKLRAETEAGELKGGTLQVMVGQVSGT